MKLPTITAFLLLGALSLAKAEEHDVKTILQKSADATSALKSYKADMLIETFASLTPQTGTIYQKKGSDGTMLMRMEMNLPTNSIPQGAASIPGLGKTYTLITSQGAFTVMGDKAMKMNGMPGMDKLKDAMNPEALKKLTQDAQSAQVNYSLTNGVVDGKECWIVSIPTSPAALEAVKKAMSEGPQKDLLALAKMKLSAIPIPAKTLIYLDKESFLIRKQESLDGNNKAIQSMTYNNIERDLELPDSLFNLPDNMQIQDMKLIMENLLKATKTTK
jgi:outer membrane lipoprotein-sorting protein